MDDKYFTACIANSPHEVAHEVIAFNLVDTNAMLHRHGNTDRITHGFHAIGNSLRLIHQTCTKGTALNAIAWAAAIQIDFVVAILLTKFGGVGQVFRFTTPKLQGDGVFFFVKP